MPKLNSPEFDGENPRLWIKRSQDYFELCQVESRAWIKIASMYFTKSAARWLQSVEKKIRTVTWFEFCQMILDRFGKEHHELLIRQLFHIKQLSSVAEYVERFSELVDQLTAYESRTDPLYYTMRFIDGLQYELRSAVLIQRPPDLDTACVLALLQEEVTAPNRNRGFRKTESLPSSKFVTRNPLPLPPTPRVDSSGVNAAAEQVRGHPQDDKWAALRAFRRAKGLCVKCAEKWSREHKCPPSA
jgi:hypothetical protein